MKNRMRTASSKRLRILVVTTAALCGGAAKAATVWTDLGAGFTTPRPAATTTREITSDEVNDVYAVQSGTGNVLHKQFWNGTPSGWSNLGGATYNSPTAVAWAGHREVFVLGTDLKLYHSYSNSGAPFTPFETLNGPTLCSAPSVVSAVEPHIDVFAWGCSNGHLIHHYYNESGWHVEDRGVSITSAPAACSPGGGKMDVWLRTAAGNMAVLQYNGGWSLHDNGHPVNNVGCAPSDHTYGSSITSFGMGIGTTTTVFATPAGDLTIWNAHDYGIPSGAGNGYDLAALYVRTRSAGMERYDTRLGALEEYGPWPVDSTQVFAGDPAVIWPDPIINGPRATKVFVVRNDGHLLMLDDTDFTGDPR